MTVEITPWSISMKVWDLAGIKLMTPGSAIRLTIHCSTWPGRGMKMILYSIIWSKMKLALETEYQSIICSS